MAIDIQSLFNPGSLQQMAETEDDRKKKAQLTGTLNLGGQTGTFSGMFDPQALQQFQNNSAPVGYQPPPNYGMQAPPEQQPVPVIQPPAPKPPVGSSPISGEFTAPPAPPAPLPPANQPYVAPPPEQFGFRDPNTGLPMEPVYTGGPALKPFDDRYPELQPGQGSADLFSGPPLSSSTTQWRQGTNGQWESYNPQLPLPIAGPIESGPIQQPVAPPRDTRYAGMPDDMYNNMMAHQQNMAEQMARYGYAADTADIKPWDMWMANQQGPVQAPSGPVAPESDPYQYNADRTQRWNSSNNGGLSSMFSQVFDPATGKWGQPGGENGEFMEGVGIGW